MQGSRGAYPSTATLTAGEQRRHHATNVKHEANRGSRSQTCDGTPSARKQPNNGVCNTNASSSFKSRMLKPDPWAHLARSTLPLPRYALGDGSRMHTIHHATPHPTSEPEIHIHHFTLHKEHSLTSQGARAAKTTHREAGAWGLKHTTPTKTNRSHSLSALSYWPLSERAAVWRDHW